VYNLVGYCYCGNIIWPVHSLCIRGGIPTRINCGKIRTKSRPKTDCKFKVCSLRETDIVRFFYQGQYQLTDYHTISFGERNANTADLEKKSQINNPSQKSWGTLHFCQHIKFMVFPSIFPAPPPTQCWFIQSTPAIPTLLWGRGDVENWIMTSHFKIMRHKFVFWQVSQGVLARIKVSTSHPFLLPGFFFASRSTYGLWKEGLLLHVAPAVADTFCIFSWFHVSILC